MRIGAVILAAGASERMKKCKALLEYAGETALARLARGAREGAGVDQVVVVAAEPHLKEISEESTRRGCEVVENRSPQMGRTMSVQLGLRAVKGHDGSFIAPVDCPLVQPADFLALKNVMGTASAGPTGPIAALPLSGALHGHPVLLSNAGIDLVMAMHPNDPLRELFRKNRDRVVDVALPARVLLNIDTPADYAKAKRQLGIRPRVRAGG